jgi:hypothetical protein
MIVDLACRKLVIRLAAIGASLIAIALALPSLAALAGRDVGAMNFHQFDLRNVGNFLVLFTTALFALATVLVVPAARLARDRRDRIGWYGLAAVFVYLALDETVRLRDSVDHLRLAPFAHPPLLATHPFLALYAAAGIALAIASWRFVGRQPRATAVAILLGAILYAAGLPGTALVTPFHAAPAAIGGGLADLLIGLLGQTLRMAGALTLIWGELRLLERARLTVELEIGIAGAEAVAPVPPQPVAPTADRHAA